MSSPSPDLPEQGRNGGRHGYWEREVVGDARRGEQAPCEAGLVGAGRRSGRPARWIGGLGKGGSGGERGAEPSPDGRFLTAFPEKVDEERDMVVVDIGVLRLVSLLRVLKERCECGDGLRGYEEVIFKGVD